MQFTKKTKILLLIFVLMLNVVIRIPSLPHSYGIDTYGIRSLSNSIATFGEARYWINMLSIGGFYPYSYASAEPFLLAGTRQLADFSTEIYPWAFGLVIGLLSFFTSFLLAKEIVKNDVYRFVVAIAFSVAPGVLIHTTWSVSTRGLFLVLYPLLLFLLVKTKEKPFRFTFLIFVFLILLAVTHHFFWFTLPGILGFVFLRTVYFLKTRTPYNSISLEDSRIPLFVNRLPIFLFFLALAYPFFTGAFITAGPSVITGSKYMWIKFLLITNVRYTGLLALFGFAGLGYLLLKERKRLNEWFVLLLILLFTPFAANLTYSKFIFIPFLCLMIGYAFNNLAASYQLKRRKLFLYVMIFFIVTSVMFSSFYQHYRTFSQRSAYNWYMLESTYEAGLWVRDNIPLDSVLVGNERATRLKTQRMNAVAGGLPRFVSGSANGLAYGFINASELKIKKNSPLTISFYQDNPYVKIEPVGSVSGFLSWMSSNEKDVDTSGTLKRFGVSYMVEGTRRTNAITRSLHEKKDVIYSNGEVKIWNLRR